MCLPASTGKRRNVMCIICIYGCTYMSHVYFYKGFGKENVYTKKCKAAVASGPGQTKSQIGQDYTKMLGR